MTVASNINKNVYMGNGATTEWPFTFKIFDESNIQIFLTDPNGAETKLDTGYRVDKQNGYVEYPYPSGTPLPSGWKITLLREVPLVQETDLVNQGPFFAEVIEDALDRLTAIDQQQQEKLDRTIILPVSAGADVSTELPTPAPLKTFRWDVTGKKLEVTDDPKVSADAAAASAAQASASATAAAVSADIAYNSASQAAASATAAANSAAQAQTLAETLQISDTPQPGKILKLDANAKLPASITGVPLAWQPNKSYSVDDICYSQNAPSYTRMECIQGGTSGTTEPTWPAVGQTVTDGTVTWKVSDIRDTRDASFVQVLTPVIISYNAAGQPETVTSEGKTYTMTYDQYKRLNTVSDGLKTIQCQYNEWGQFTGTVIVL